MTKLVTTTEEVLSEQSGAEQPRMVYGLGELSLGLVREWGPVLKPTGVGLLTTIHAWEEQNPRSPFYGWMHVAQEALAAYLDMGRTSIIRYRNLLDACGLVEQREVSYRRPGMKLHQTLLRVTRAEVQPSLGLLEYLVFEADEWTRKHTAWLLTSYQTVGESELGRLIAMMRRGYRVQAGASGLATIVEGERLTVVGSFAARLVQRALGEQPELLEGEGGKGKGESGLSTVSLVDSGASGQPKDLTGEKTSVGQSYVPLLDTGGGSAGVLLAPDGLMAGGGVSPRVTGRGSDVASGVGGEGSGVSSGVNLNVNDSLLVNGQVNQNENVNVTADSVMAVAMRGAGRIDDTRNVAWHVLCVGKLGKGRYEQAIAATERKMAEGKLRGRPGQYFTRTAKQLAVQIGVVLSKAAPNEVGGMGHGVSESNVSLVDSGEVQPTDLTTEKVERGDAGSSVSPVNSGGDVVRYMEPEMAMRQAWQAAMTELAERLRGPAWFGWLQHVRLLAADEERVVVGMPSNGLAELMAKKHGAEVAAVFGAVLGREVRLEFVTRWQPRGD